MTTSGRPYFSRIDGLRGVGALLVATYHLWPGASEGFPSRSALMMFFVISGFVLSVSLTFGARDRRGVLGFCIGRFCRIYSLALLSTLVVLVLRAAHVPTTGGPPLTAVNVITNTLLVDVSANPTLWALQLECLMVPVIVCMFFVTERFGTRALACTAIATSALSFSNSWAIWPPLSHHLFPFIVGMLVARLVVGNDGHITARVLALTRGTCGALTLTALVVLLFAGPVLGFYSNWSALVESWAAAVPVGVVAARTDAPATAWLGRAWVRRLGLAAGSYYVLHMPLAPAVRWSLAMAVPPTWSAFAPTTLSIALFVATLIVLVPISLLSFRWIETPGVTLGRRIRVAMRGAGHRLTP